MFKRTIENELKLWKISTIRKPLVLRGARQVGKTSVIRQFAKDNFDDLFEINLESKEQYRIFEGVLNVDDFLRRLEINRNKKLVPSKSLLFIDEIQESSEIFSLLRFFAEERPDIFIIATGSLLEAKLNIDFKVPVGRIEYKYLYPLTFFEYLNATGNKILMDEINNLQVDTNYSWNDLANEEYKRYVLIGGMPEVVANYSKNKDYFNIKQILSRLYSTYIDDVSKYTRSFAEKKYLEWVVEAGPRLGGEVFKYENFAGSEFKSREMSDAFRLIEKIMILNQIVSVNSTNLPLNFKFKRPKKLIWLDVGIVNYSKNAYSDLMKGNYSGKIMEQIVGQTLVALFSGRNNQLGYWAKNKDEGNAEVDFCWEYQNKIIGLEVKSGIGLKSRSLISMIKSGKGKIVPIEMSFSKLEMKKDGILSLPFYLLERWQDFIN